MVFTCTVVRGSSAFTPCLDFRERSCWGGGGRVANALFHFIRALGIILSIRLFLTCTM